MSAIAENLERAQAAIAAACRSAGRPSSEVRLMAVSKTHPVEALLEAARAGQRLFGENRVQEFAAKAPALPAAAADLSVAVHLIGHLQTNKSAAAAELFAAVDTLDSLRLAERLHTRARELNRALPVLVEIKLSEEPTKEGLAPDAPELASLLEALVGRRDHLPLRGLMTVAPFSPDPAVARACFRQLRMLRDRLAREHPRLSFDELSMGMSADFEAAIAEGSTVVRLGTAIFGPRPKPQEANIRGKSN